MGLDFFLGVQNLHVSMGFWGPWDDDCIFTYYESRWFLWEMYVGKYTKLFLCIRHGYMEGIGGLEW